jgi:hypothetical protein
MWVLPCKVKGAVRVLLIGNLFCTVGQWEKFLPMVGLFFFMSVVNTLIDR